MSRCPGRHAKNSSRYEGRHIKPGGPGPAAVVGTAAKAVPASLMVGAAGSMLALSGTASAATAATAAPGSRAYGTSDLAAVKTTAFRTTISPGRHAAASQQVYTVVTGDTLSAISGRFCGTSADYPALAAASGIKDPNVIYAGQAIKLSCHHATATLTAASSGDGDGDGDGDTSDSAAPAASSSNTTAQAAAPTTASTSGMSSFEACVIQRESGGNPSAVNPVSGAGGLFQFLPSTWAALGFSGLPEDAPVAVQEQAFAKEYAEAGTSPWAPYDGC